MFIQTEETPNPLALKFVPGKQVMGEGTFSVTAKEEAWQCPLIESLFQITGVAEVFLSSDFISVTKTAEYDWVLLKPQVLGSIMEYFMEHEEVVIHKDTKSAAQSSANQLDGYDQLQDENLDDDTREIIGEIKELIESRIRPAVAQDGGDITFERFVEGIVYLKMHGACSGCPSSTITLKNGVENMLRHYVPEVKEVRSL